MKVFYTFVQRYYFHTSINNLSISDKLYTVLYVYNYTIINKRSCFILFPEVRKYVRATRDELCESMNQPRFKICRADETSVLPVSTNNLPFNSLSKLFFTRKSMVTAPETRARRAVRHAKKRCRCAVRRRRLLSLSCPCGNFFSN